MAGEIVARYFEPFRREVGGRSPLAHEVLKNVTPSIFLNHSLKINANMLMNFVLLSFTECYNFLATAHERVC